MARTSYLITLGSNMPHGRYGPPRRVIAAALEQLDLAITACSPVIQSRPIGPSRRTYANAVAWIETDLSPTELIYHFKILETAFGRRTSQRWGARVLDLDIILWSGGLWISPGLIIPHLAFRNRAFVIGPANTIVPNWRDPLSGLCIKHMKARLDRKRRRA